MDWHIQGDDVYSGPWLVARLTRDVPATVRDAVESEIAAWDGRSAWRGSVEELIADARADIADAREQLSEARAEIDRLSAELAALKNPPLPPDEDEEE